MADLLLRVPHPGGQVRSPVAAVLIDDRAVAELGRLPWPRWRLAELVERTRSLGARAVVVDLVLSEPGDQDGDLALERALTAGPTVLAAVLRPDGGWLLPLERFGGARVAAHAHAEVSSDGVVREVSMTKQADGMALAALAVAAARHAGWDGAVTPGRLLRPDFRESPAAIRSLGAAVVLGEHPPPDLLRNRVVLLGFSASGAGDQLVVPVGFRRRPAPGVLVHAAVASSLLRGGLLRSMPPYLMLVVALLLAVTVQLARTRAGRVPVPWLIVLLTGIGIGSLASLWAVRLMVAPVSLAVAVVTATIVREVVESREAQRETGAILGALIERQEAAVAAPAPVGVQGRLRLVHALQEQLGRDRDLRRTLLEGLEEGVVLWDRAGAPLLGNAAIERLWGTRPSLGEVTDALGARAAETGRPPTEVARGGRVLEVEVRPLQDGALGLVRDVTARHELDRRRREMQRLVSHELKTPLASIAGFGSMIERYSLSSEELHRVAALIRGEAERLGEMVRTFLDLERLGAGAWQLERGPVRLDELVRRRVELIGSAAAERGQRITVEVDPAPPVSGAAQLVERLIDNLVGNALKYSPDGSAVEVIVRPDDAAVVLEVRDFGAGIPAESLPHVFERFYRVPGTAAGGSGLGLAVVREVADWHGAEVTVDSAPGRGSTFTVRFPAGPTVGGADAGSSPGR
jgi:signal transduction histidine kinase